MASCEPTRTKAYSEDLRWRMIYQYHGLRKSMQEVAQCLNVDKSTVCRTISLFDGTGTVAKRCYPSSHSATHCKLSDVDKYLIVSAAIDKPGIYLSEIKQKLLEEHGTDVSISSICKFFHKEAGFTRQKMVITAKQQSDALRVEYLMDMSVFSGDSKYFIFIDETGTDGRDRIRQFGYSLRGNPAVSNKLLFRGNRVSALA